MNIVAELKFTRRFERGVKPLKHGRNSALHAIKPRLGFGGCGSVQVLLLHFGQGILKIVRMPLQNGLQMRVRLRPALRVSWRLPRRAVRSNCG